MQEIPSASSNVVNVTTSGNYSNLLRFRKVMRKLLEYIDYVSGSGIANTTGANAGDA
jgi:hypothetical protein